MYDVSAEFDLLDATYLGKALSDADYLWYTEPMREFNVTAYKWLAERVDVPLIVAEVAEGAHMKTADFIAAGCAAAVSTSTGLRGGFTGAMRTAHLADAFLLRAEVHGPGKASRHLCMAISNTTYYESLIDSNPVRRPAEVDASGNIHAPTRPGVGFEEAWVDGPPASRTAALCDKLNCAPRHRRNDEDNRDRCPGRICVRSDGGDLVRPLTRAVSNVQALGVAVIAPGSRGRWLARVLLAGKSRLDAERVSARVNGLARRGNHRPLFDRGDSSGGDRCPARRGRPPDREHRNRSLKGEMT